MTKPPEEAEKARGVLVSTEGIPGVGKSFLSARAMKSRLAGHNIVLYEEIDTAREILGSKRRFEECATCGEQW